MAETRPVTLDHLKSSKKPVTVKCWIPLDNELAEAHQAAEEKLKAARARHRFSKESDDKATLHAEVLELEREVESALAVLRANSVAMVFKSIGRAKFDKLVSEHPPASKQLQQVKDAGGDPATLGWNPDTFVPALIARCSVEPQLTEQDVKDLQESDEWNTSEIGAMFSAALAANTRHYNLNLDILGNGSSGTKNSN